MSKPITIAIDGPAASGKSTVGCELAKRLSYLYFDTGVMYRAVTWAALQQDLSIADEDAVTALAQQLHIDVLPVTVDDGRQYTILADGQDITWAIREPEVEAGVSTVSAYPGVREALVAQQRRISAQGRVVMVGRDIGTVVLPAADLKLYLDAQTGERAQRRYEELIQRGQKADYQGVLAAMQKRDKIDSGRKVSPLHPADDAIILDTSDLTIEQVLHWVEELIQENTHSNAETQKGKDAEAIHYNAETQRSKDAENV
jgi:cytidylate kinase